MWKLQIAKENDDSYVDYLVQEPIKIYSSDNKLKAYSLYGKYYGSSTRIGEIGTIYYQNTQKFIKIKVRLIDDNNNILFNKLLSEDDINGLININSSFKINNAKIHTRDLHRWHGYPFEISGITIYI